MSKRQTPICETCESRDTNLFCSLHAPELESFNRHKTQNRYRKGQIIFYDGNQAFGVFCIQRGRVKLYKLGPQGHPQIVRLAGPGNLLGYRSLLSNEPYHATAEALEDCDICCIDREAFLSVARGNQDMAFKLLRKLSQELRQAEDLATSIAQKSARERMAELLIHLKEAYGRQESLGFSIDLHLSREEMGEMIGITQETAIRLLSDFKKSKFIHVNERQITILNLPALLHAAALEV